MNMDVIQDASLSRRQLRFSLAFETHVHRQSQVTARLTTCEIHSNGHLDYGVSYELRSGVSKQPNLLPTQDNQMLFARCCIYKWAFRSVRESMYFMYMWQFSEALDKSRHWRLGLVVTQWIFLKVNFCMDANLDYKKAIEHYNHDCPGKTMKYILHTLTCVTTCPNGRSYCYSILGNLKQFD